MATPIDVVVFKCRKICLTLNRWNRGLFSGQTTNTISPASQTVVTACIVPKMCQGQPPTMCSGCSRFRPNRSTVGRVI